MTKDEAEAIYDAEIAPALRNVVNRCKELNMHIVAHVEFYPGDHGVTQHVPDGASVTIQMTQLAARSHGNFDALAFNMLRRFDCKASLILHKYGEEKSAKAKL